MKLEEQLAKLAELGLKLNDGVTVDDLLNSFDREDYEERPFDLVLFVLGIEVERPPWGRSVCSRVWNFDTECIARTGDYAQIVKRLCEVAGQPDYLTDVADFVDLDAGTAWIQYKVNGIERNWAVEVSDDWVDRLTVRSITFSPNGALVAAIAPGAGTAVSLWDARTGRLVREFQASPASAGRLEAIAFSPDSTRLAAGDVQGVIHLWEIATGRVLFLARERTGNGYTIRCIAFSPDGKRIADGGSDGTVRLSSTTDGAVVSSHPTTVAPLVRGGGFGGGQAGITCLTFSSDGSLLAAGSDGSCDDVKGNVPFELKAGRLLIWIFDEPANPLIIDAQGQPKSLCLTQDGRQLICGTLANAPDAEFPRLSGPLAEVRAWDARTGKQLKQLSTAEPERGLGCIGLSADELRLCMTGRERVTVWRFPSGQLERTSTLPHLFGWYGDTGFAISPNCKSTASSTGDKLLLWSLDSGAVQE